MKIQSSKSVADLIRHHFLNGDSGVGPATPRPANIHQTQCAGSWHRSTELGPAATGTAAIS